MRTLLPCLVIALTLLPPAAARAGSAPDEGTAFEPRPVPAARFTLGPVESHLIAARDGVELALRIVRPAPGAATPPARVPVVLVLTPYGGAGAPFVLADELVPHGYAVVEAQVRGSGDSGGCLDLGGPDELDDSVRAIEWAASAPFSDGRVGLYGMSYEAIALLGVLARGDDARLASVHAAVSLSGAGGWYDQAAFDGVPWVNRGLGSAATQGLFGSRPGPQTLGRRVSLSPGCATGPVDAADAGGDLTPYWQAREARPGAGRIDVPLLLAHGYEDERVTSNGATGVFDRLAPGTPRAAVLGHWQHDYPDDQRVMPEWSRADWPAMVLAWLDRYVRGEDTRVEEWPRVQVQDTTGQWRTADDFPATGGRPGRLALGAGGALGVTSPSGSTAFVEPADHDGTAPGTSAVFVTPPLEAPLRVAGHPVADLWLTVDRPDAHLAVELELLRAGESRPTLDQDRTSLLYWTHVHVQFGPARLGTTYGFRSLRHLEPIGAAGFTQQRGVPAPVGVPLRVGVRLAPNDILAGPGDRLRLTVTGAKIGHASSYSATRVTILHDCEHPSTLRFEQADDGSRLLNVREADEPAGAPLASSPAPVAPPDAAGAPGLADAPVC